MAEKNKLRKLAAERGVTEKELVQDLITAWKTDFKAAQMVGMYPNAIRMARRRLGIPSSSQQTA